MEPSDRTFGVPEGELREIQAHPLRSQAWNDE